MRLKRAPHRGRLALLRVRLLLRLELHLQVHYVHSAVYWPGEAAPTSCAGYAALQASLAAVRQALSALAPLSPRPRRRYSARSRLHQRHPSLGRSLPQRRRCLARRRRLHHRCSGRSLPQRRRCSARPRRLRRRCSAPQARRRLERLGVSEGLALAPPARPRPLRSRACLARPRSRRRRWHPPRLRRVRTHCCRSLLAVEPLSGPLVSGTWRPCPGTLASECVIWQELTRCSKVPSCAGLAAQPDLGAARDLEALREAYTPGAPRFRFQHLLLNVVDAPGARAKPPGVDELRWREALQVPSTAANPF